MKLIKLAALFLVFNMSSARAFMPTYHDDAEFDKCIMISPNGNICIQEETHRVLAKVKRQYKAIVSDPRAISWTGSVEKNVKTLQDMFDSWTAFRNRLCSLSNKATKYMERLYEEKDSCKLYYTLHHEDHLNGVLTLLNSKTLPAREDFKFLKIYDHDDEYTKCLEKEDADEALCLDEELQRCTRAIKNLYKTLSEDKYVGQWNNGDGLKSGNYRDMFDSWIAYRNRMCSLSVWAYHSRYGEDSIRLNDCIQFYNREKMETLSNLLVSAHSSIDGFAGDYEDDGGLAEGKTIKPLDEHIGGGDEIPAEELVATNNQTEPEKKKASFATKKTKQEPEKEKVNKPSWAGK